MSLLPCPHQPAGGNLLTVILLGRTDYEEALKWQLDLVQWRREGTVGDTLLVTEHQPVITLGRACSPEDLPDPRLPARHGIALCETTRGGRATYHGPGQLVGYPILDLRERGCDLHRFMDDIQDALITALGRLGVEARARPGLRGAWVADRKIAAIGVAVRRWVSYHGFALNVDCDLGPFRLISPCGMSGARVTSVAEVLGRAPDRNLVRQVVVEDLAKQFRYAGWVAHSPLQGAAGPRSECRTGAR